MTLPSIFDMSRAKRRRRAAYVSGVLLPTVVVALFSNTVHHTRSTRTLASSSTGTLSLRHSPRHCRCATISKALDWPGYKLLRPCCLSATSASGPRFLRPFSSGLCIPATDHEHDASERLDTSAPRAAVAVRLHSNHPTPNRESAHAPSAPPPACSGWPQRVLGASPTVCVRVCACLCFCVCA